MSTLLLVLGGWIVASLLLTLVWALIRRSSRRRSHDTPSALPAPPEVETDTPDMERPARPVSQTSSPKSPAIADRYRSTSSAEAGIEQVGPAPTIASQTPRLAK